MRLTLPVAYLTLPLALAIGADISATERRQRARRPSDENVKPLERQSAILPDNPPIRFKHLFTLEGEEGRGQYLLEFSPDGATLAAARSGGNENNDAPPGYDVALWDIRKRIIVHVLPHTQDPENTIGAIAFVPPGDRLVTGCWSLNKVFLWDVRTGKLLDTLNTGGTPSYGITGLATFPDGKRAVCCADSGVIVWDLETKTHKTLPLEEFVPLRPGETRPVPRFCYSVAFTADGSRFATTVADYGLFLPRILLWDAKRCRVTRVIPMGTGTHGFAYAPDGSTVAATTDRDPAVSQEPIVSVWDASTGKKLLAGKPFDGDALDLAYTRDGKYLLMAGSKGPPYTDPLGRRGGKIVIGVWDVATGKIVNRVAPAAYPCHMAISPDNKLLAVPGRDIDIYAIEYTRR